MKVDNSLFEVIVNKVTGVELIIIISILAIAYFFVNKQKTDNIKRFTELTERTTDLIAELKAQVDVLNRQTGILARRYTSSITKDQSTSLINLVFDSSMKAIITEAWAIKERNNVEANAKVISRNLTDFVVTRFATDKSTLDTFKYDETSLGSYMNTDWKRIVIHSVIECVVDKVTSFEQFKDGIKMEFNTFSVEVRDKMSGVDTTASYMDED